MVKKQEKDLRIAGASFSIHPMSDDFCEIIKSSISEVDDSKVWLQVDEVSTIARGRIAHIFDVTQAIYLSAANTVEHVTFNATYSIGCPGDSEGHTYMAEDDEKLNKKALEEIEQQIAAKFALYPMGGENYMNIINKQIEVMKEQDIDVTITHYETRLDGMASDIFEGLEKVFRATEEAGSDHTVMTVTASANSPSHEI